MHSPAFTKKVSPPAVFDGGYLGHSEVLAAFDGALQSLKNALYYSAVGNKGGRTASLQDCQNRLRRLAASIEPDPAVPASENLARLLHFIVFSLDSAMRTGKSSPVNEAAAMLQPIRETFASMT